MKPNAIELTRSFNTFILKRKHFLIANDGSQHAKRWNESVQRNILVPKAGGKTPDCVHTKTRMSVFLLRINVGRVDSLEGGDGDVGNVGVQLVDAVLVFVALAGESKKGAGR